MIPRQSSGPAYLQGPAAFITHYIKRHAASFGTLLFLVACAAGAAVSTQYVMKLLVDGTAGPRRIHAIRHEVARGRHGRRERRALGGLDGARTLHRPHRLRKRVLA